MFKALLCYVLLTAAALANSNTLTPGLRAGVYDGQSRDIKMFVRDLPGRDGSFLALIIKDGEKAVPYLVDEFAIGRYGFIPLYNQKNLSELQRHR